MHPHSNNGKRNGHKALSKDPLTVWTDHQPWPAEEHELPAPAPGGHFTSFTPQAAHAWCAHVKDWCGDVVILSGGGGNTLILAELVDVIPAPEHHGALEPARRAIFKERCPPCGTGEPHYSPTLWNIRPVLHLFEAGPNGADDWVRTPHLGLWIVRRLLTDGQPVRAKDLRQHMRDIARERAEAKDAAAKRPKGG